jgi:hypothetical protein
MTARKKFKRRVPVAPPPRRLRCYRRRRLLRLEQAHRRNRPLDITHLAALGSRSKRESEFMTAGIIPLRDLPPPATLSLRSIRSKPIRHPGRFKAETRPPRQTKRRLFQRNHRGPASKCSPFDRPSCGEKAIGVSPLWARPTWGRLPTTRRTKCIGSGPTLFTARLNRCVIRSDDARAQPACLSGSLKHQTNSRRHIAPLGK